MPLRVPSAASHGPNGQHSPILTLFEISMQIFSPQENFEEQAGAIRNRAPTRRVTIKLVKDSGRHNILEVGYS